MSLPTTIFKFATIRNATDKTTTKTELKIQPSTALVKSLVEIIESDKKQPDKINSINEKLSAFIQSPDFFKTKAQVAGAISKSEPGSDQPLASKLTDTRSEDTSELNNLYENLYDNIVVRTITKSTTNEVFKSLTDNIRTLHQKLNAGKEKSEGRQQPKIILPEGLVISFSPPTPTPALPPSTIDKDRTALFAQIQDLTTQKQQLQKSQAEYSTQIATEQQRLSRQQVEKPDVQVTETAKGITEAARPAATQEAETQRRVESNPALDQLVITSERLQASEREIDTKLSELNYQAFQLLPKFKYTFIGDRWTDTRRFEEIRAVKIEGDSIMVYSQGCYLKFPFQVADLRIIEQQSVGYLPAEIAHINNTQQGELHEKVTRRLKRIETFESLITEDETFRETDTQSTEKFTLEKAASEIQSEESAFNVNTGVSGTYGVVTAYLDAGYSNSQSTQNANSASQSYAREIVQRVVDRVSSKVKKERSIKTIEEFEETVKHVIDNRKSKGPKSYVYRWLTKLSRATLKNYGKRLIFQIDVAHPSHYYLSRAIKNTSLQIPPNPRDLKKKSDDPQIRAFYEKTRFPFEFKVDDINRGNYLAWADLYNAKLEQPQLKKISVNNGFASDKAENVAKTITIPKGYKCLTARVKLSFENLGRHYLYNEDGASFRYDHGMFKYMVGVKYGIALTGYQQQHEGIIDSSVINLDNLETEALPLSIFHFEKGYIFNIEVECELTGEAEKIWQIKCYNAILEAYDALKAEAENKMGDFNPNMPGLNPTRKSELIKSELKKGALSKMFRCNPFWITDTYEVGNEYHPDCCQDSLNGEKVRLLETLFDCNNITYELYPYSYADKDNWAGLLNLSDDDPHFEAFLQASFATVRIPVYRDSLKEIAAVNFIMNNSIANYAVVPASIQSLLEDLESATPFKTDQDGKLVYEYDKDGNKVPYYSTVLGIFPVPTDLVILECGVENGVKPIGFPQTAPETTEAPIPKQYSPAIIADSCPVIPDEPEDVEPE
jgi:hypothetical protein